MGLKEEVLLYDDYSFAQLIGNCNIHCSHYDCRFSPATAGHEHSTTGISIFQWNKKNKNKNENKNIRTPIISAQRLLEQEGLF